MNIKIAPQVEADFKCHIIEKYGKLRGNLEHDVNIALLLFIECEKKGIALDTINYLEAYFQEVKNNALANIKMN